VFDAVVFWLSLVGGVVECILVGWLLLLLVGRGKLGRVLGTVVYGLTGAVTGAVPFLICSVLEWLGTLVGYSLSVSDRITMPLSLVYYGMAIALAATVLFAAVMVLQALSGSGRASERP